MISTINEPPNLSLLRTDKVWYPIKDFFDEYSFKRAEFKTDNEYSQIYSMDKLISSYNLVEDIGHIYHIEKLSDNLILALNSKNELILLSIKHEDSFRVTIEKRIAIADPEKYRCLKVVSPHLNHMIFVPCIEISILNETTDIKSKINTDNKSRATNVTHEKPITPNDDQDYSTFKNDKNKSSRILQNKVTAQNYSTLLIFEVKYTILNESHNLQKKLENKKLHFKKNERSKVHPTNINFIISIIPSSQKLRMIMYISTPLSNKNTQNNMSIINMHYFIIDPNEGIIDISSIEYDIERAGYSEYRGIQIHNNLQLVLLARKKYGNSQIRLVELKIDLNLKKIVVEKSYPVFSRLHFSSLVEVKDNQSVQMFMNSQGIIDRISVCHIRRMKDDINQCIYHSLADQKIKLKNEEILDYILRDRILILVFSSKESSKVRFVGSIGTFDLDSKLYPPLSESGYPLIIGNLIYKIQDSKVSVYPAISPHLVIDAKKLKDGQIQVTGIDAEDSKTITIQIQVIKQLRNDISNAPPIFDIEINSNDKQDKFQSFSLESVVGNVKSVELKLEKEQEDRTFLDEQLSVKIKVSETVDFPFKHDFYLVDQKVMLTVDKKTQIQIHTECQYFSSKDEYLCKNHSPVKELIANKDNNIDIQIKSFIVDGNLMIADLYSLVEDDTFILIGGSTQKHKKKGVKIHLQKVDQVLKNRKDTISGFVKISSHYYSFIQCNSSTCLVSTIQMKHNQNVVKFIGYIDQIFLKDSLFCPKKVISTGSQSNILFIYSSCPASTGVNINKEKIFKVQIFEEIIHYQSMMVVDSEFSEVLYCSDSLFAFYNKNASIINFRRFDTPLLLERNTIDTSEFNIDKIYEVHCKFSTILVIGENNVEKQDKKRQFLVLERNLKASESESSYIDNKSSIARLSGEIDDYDNMTITRSSSNIEIEDDDILDIDIKDIGSEENYLFLILQKAERRWVQVIQTIVGPTIEIKRKDKNKALKFDFNFKLKVTGYLEDKVSHLEQTFKIYSKNFDISLNGKQANTNNELKKQSYPLDNFFDIESGQITSMYYSSFNRNIATIDGPLRSFTPVGFQSENKFHDTVFNGVRSSNTRLVALEYEPINNKNTKNSKRKSKVLQTNLKFYFVKENDLLFTYKHGDHPSNKYLNWGYYFDETKNHHYLSLVYRVKHFKDQWIMIKIDDLGKIIDIKNTKIRRNSHDSFNLFVKDDAMFMVSSKTDSNNKIVITFHELILGLDTFTLKILGSTKRGGFSSVSYVKLDNEIVVITSDIDSYIKVEYFSMKDRMFLAKNQNDKFKISNNEIDKLICTSKNDLNYIAHCIAINFRAQTSNYLKIQRDLTKNHDVYPFYIPENYQRLGVEYEWDLGSNHIAYKTEGAFKDLSKHKLDQKLIGGILIWNINGIEKNIELPFELIPNQDEHSSFKFYSPRNKITEDRQIVEYLFLTNNFKNENKGFFEVRSKQTERSLNIDSPTKFYKDKDKKILILGLEDYVEIKVHSIFKRPKEVIKIDSNKQKNEEVNNSNKEINNIIKNNDNETHIPRYFIIIIVVLLIGYLGMIMVKRVIHFRYEIKSEKVKQEDPDENHNSEQDKSRIHELSSLN